MLDVVEEWVGEPMGDQIPQTRCMATSSAQNALSAKVNRSGAASIKVSIGKQDKFADHTARLVVEAISERTRLKLKRPPAPKHGVYLDKYRGEQIQSTCELGGHLVVCGRRYGHFAMYPNRNGCPRGVLNRLERDERDVVTIRAQKKRINSASGQLIHNSLGSKRRLRPISVRRNTN